MAEFAAFHYLMHKKGDTGPSRPAMSMDDFSKQFGGSKPKALPTFDELFSPRDRRQISCVEKLFWRTNERLEIRIFEVRKSKVLLITVFNTTTHEEYRPICVDLTLLFQIIENKKQGRTWSDSLEKRMLNDSELRSNIQDFILARLKLSEKENSTESPRHCFLDKSFGDEYSSVLMDGMTEVVLQELLQGIERKGHPNWQLQKCTEPPPDAIIDASTQEKNETSIEPVVETAKESPPKATGGSGANAARTLKKQSPPKPSNPTKVASSGKAMKQTTKKP